MRNSLTKLSQVQPKYTNDLARSAASISKVLSETRKRMYKNPKKLDVEEISSYLIDILCSLNSFLHVYPEASLVLGKEGLLNAVVLTYDVVLPKFEPKIQQKLRRPFISLGRKIVQYFLNLIEGNATAMEDVEKESTEEDLEDVANDFYEMMKGKRKQTKPKQLRSSVFFPVRAKSHN